MKEKNSNHSEIVAELSLRANPLKAKVMQGFFKTGEGEYGANDIFIGVAVPEQRKIAKRYHDLTLTHIKKLFESDIHEHRLTALLILVDQFENASQKNRKRIFDFYITNRQFVNNWDLVDSSAYQIVGVYLCSDRSCTLLKQLARSHTIWDRRIGIVATYAMIRNKRFDIPLVLATILVNDTHDLIQKAVGWMLREAGKRDEMVLKTFLDSYAHVMPRTMLRYALERLSENDRRAYMAKKQ